MTPPELALSPGAVPVWKSMWSSTHDSRSYSHFLELPVISPIPKMTFESAADRHAAALGRLPGTWFNQARRVLSSYEARSYVLGYCYLLIYVLASRTAYLATSRSKIRSIAVCIYVFLFPILLGKERSSGHDFLVISIQRGTLLLPVDRHVHQTMFGRSNRPHLKARR
jgi:hypothetical protein